MLFGKLAEYYDRLEGVSSRLKMMEILSELFKEAGKKEVVETVYMTQGTLLPPFEGLEFGVADKLMEEAIALATGYTKEQVHSEYKKAGDLGIAAQKLKQGTKLKQIVKNDYSVKEVYEMMVKVARTSGQGSKDQKIGMLANMIASASPLAAKYLVRYPLANLRMGVGDSTIMEALAIAYAGGRDAKEELERAYNICSDLGEVGKAVAEGGMKEVGSMKVTLFKPVRPALAERLPTAEQIIERLGGEVSVEQKYDGFRIQVHKKGKEVRLYSRRLENITEMFPDVIKAVNSELDCDRIIFEGEALAYNEATGEFLPFQETIQRKRKHGIEEKAMELPLHLFAFDILYYDGKDCLSKPYKERRELIERLFGKGKAIGPTRRILTSKPKELELFFEESIEGGLEGIMAKDLKSPYIAGARKFSWVKLKRSYKNKLSDTVDLVIVGYYLGRGSRAEFGFGGLLCAVYNDKRDVFETVSRIGTGFTEKQMSELKSMLSKIKSSGKPARVEALVEPDFWVQPKYVVTINADEITRSPMHTCGKKDDKEGVGYALRFPRLYGGETVRGDKGPEDATTTKEIMEMFRMQKKVGLKES
ncbi:MAG: ATP-dependent DNA ligase [Candidatus Micrarchaeota archaeon]|nr:ATP-dependent DNA ligase [Candidatus Micrarchaeota archaeon]